MLSAVAETFANWKLRNKSDVNQTYMAYVYTTLPHFISKKMRVWMKGGMNEQWMNTYIFEFYDIQSFILIIKYNKSFIALLRDDANSNLAD